MAFDLVHHTSLQFLMIHISFPESGNKIKGEDIIITKHVMHSLWLRENAEAP